MASLCDICLLQLASLKIHWRSYITEYLLIDIFCEDMGHQLVKLQRHHTHTHIYIYLYIYIYIHPNPHKRQSIARPWGYDMGVYFANITSGVYFALVILVPYAKSCYVGPRYSDTRLYNGCHFWSQNYHYLLFSCAIPAPFDYQKKCPWLISVGTTNSCGLLAPFAPVLYVCFTCEHGYLA